MIEQLDQKSIFNQKSSEVFEGKTHVEYYLHRMTAYRDRIVICHSDGANELAKLPDASLDLIYIDGSHHYVDVTRDCAVAREKIKPGGILIFNDYIIWSHWERMWYGIVPVVNDLIVNGGGKVIGFA